MPERGDRGRWRLLSVGDRLAEVVAGIIITLSFTASLSIGTAGEAEVQTALYGALGCGVAWGIVDGVLYVLSSMATRGRALASARAASAETNPVVARKHMADVMPFTLAATLRDAELDAIVRRVREVGVPGNGIAKDDVLGGVEIFFLVSFATVPIALPFLFIGDLKLALRASDVIGMVMLFLCGYWAAARGSFSPIRTGSAMLGIGLALLAATIVLGG
jgi:VIT1/CCC1 family predicted Fe2+/Mn2+ transporter